MKSIQLLYPKNYDTNAKCDYDGGTIGDFTERCLAFRHKVHSLIDSERLTFQEDKPSVRAIIFWLFFLP